MSVTVLGVFADWQNAKAFKQQLISSGIAESAIRTTPGSDAHASTTHLSEDDKGFWQNLKELFTGEDYEEAGYYAEATRRGGVLVTVQAPEDRAVQITGLMKQAGAIDVQGRAQQWKQAGWKGYDEKATPLSAPELKVAREQDAVLPVVEEKLAIGKREVTTGGVRVLRRVIETPVHENVSLRSEHVDVQRRPVDRALSGTDLNNAFTDKTVELTEKREEAVVSKTARVVEEVTVSKGAEEHVETINDTVRRTDVQVEKVPASGTTTTTNTANTTNRQGPGTTNTPTKPRV